ncbi:hypothetical protein GUITHDRAFT_107714 [Guillardia theta CCMP2712]|uniref:Uncharacterized protein n=1 Tax=Guillardia theta (strain CCMP2712) TaxID=905079 RepID=L1JEE4_GUITC|nr:hypothetical protein GUITHDRAFT_107714 [Guillardia theta CCMP2712]EKX46509.1 hypothetical protein GUITHDRAFT_107714 [Guillardia theta CCMP2712]|eukprot:XP_005833489.1 hypothetical protein GUITHDRAFT_107714 [Guillardia theta CCMP2712]
MTMSNTSQNDDIETASPVDARTEIALSTIIEVNHASFLDAFVRNYTQQPGNFMDLALKDRHVYRHDPLLSVFSWEPITSFMTSRAGQLIALLVAVPWLVVRIYEVAALRQQDFFFPSISSMHVILEPRAIPSNVSCGWDARLELLSWFFPPLALLMAGIGAALDRVQWVNKIFVFFGALDAACNMLIFLRLEVRGDYHKTMLGTPSFLFLLVAVKDVLLFPGPLLYSESSAIELGLLSNVVYACAAGAWLVSYQSIIVIIVLSMVLMLRRALVYRGERMIAGDRAAFCREWEGLADRSKEAIQHLSKQVREYTSTMAERVARADDETAEDAEARSSLRQLHTLYGSGRSLTETVQKGTFVVEQRSAAGPVNSLDQLYAHAVLIEPIFREKALGLAAEAKGMIPLRLSADDKREYVRLEDIRGDVILMRHVEWPRIKNVDRAIDKILRLCDGQTSRLLDVVRQCIVFERLEDLCECLERILGDPEIVVMRIKNRLDPSFDARTTGGYRDVAVNLRVVTERTRELGVAGHVCELRLGVMGMHVLSTRERRLRYRGVKQVLRYERAWWSKEKVCSKVENVSIQVSMSQVSESIESTQEGLSRAQGRMQTFEQCDDCPQSSFMKYKGKYPGGIMDEKLRNIVTGIQNTMTSSVIFSSNPVKNTLQKVTTQVVLLAVAGFLTYMYVASLNVSGFLENKATSVYVARLHIQEYRDQAPRASIPSASVSNFSLMLDSCNQRSPASTKTVNNTLYFFFAPPAEANGWHFSLNPDKQLAGYDPIAFNLSILERPVGSGEEVESVSGKAWKDWTSFSCRERPGMGVCKEGEAYRGARMYFNVQYLVFRILAILISIIQPLVCILAVVTARLGYRRVPKTMFASLFHVVGVFEIFFFAVGNETTGSGLIWGIGDLSFGMVIEFREQYMMTVLPFYSIFTSVGVSSLVTHGYKRVPDISNLGWSNFPLIAMWLYFTIGRKLHLHRAFKNVKSELLKYNDLWESLSSSQTSRLTLERIGQLVSQVQVPTRLAQSRVHDPDSPLEESSSPLEWMLRKSQGGSFSLRVPSKSVWPLSKDPRVVSLDQLYAQAVFADPIFRKKVQELAEESRGLFPALPSGSEGLVECIGWREAKEDEELQQRIRWAPMKSVDRAVEKLVRSYNNDVSRLLDVVRQCIVFEQLEDLCECLERILGDPEIVVMRIKNRLDPSFDARTTGGYRDVAVNLRVVTERTRELGVAGHVCELQLLVKGFMDLRTTEGHKRYVAYRNLRCE